MKLYDKYLELKKENNDNLYLFKSGIFYIFLDKDAIKVNSITTLELTKYSKNIFKCGFPKQSLEKYLNIFNNLGIKITLTRDDNNDLDKYLDRIRKIDIEKITPIESMNILSELKSKLNE